MHMYATFVLISTVLDQCVDYSAHDGRFGKQINHLYCIVLIKIICEHVY